MTKSRLGKESEIKKLLAKKRPNYRQAYSDRTAWLMACLSELAYDKDKLTIKTVLDKLGGRLVWVGDESGTQCIIVKFDDFHVLAFRGTEATSFTDIKADVKAIKKASKSGGQLHSGFSDAHDCIKVQIEAMLKKNIGEKAEENSLPLCITGHSLGGALATIATKELHAKFKIAACYTFGSPRVGDANWVAGLRSPVYRIVNAADSVTMLPPTFLWLVSNFKSYIHSGDMRYLTNISDGDYSKVKLLPHMGVLRRSWQIFKTMRVASFLVDHKISIYRKKLFVIANKKNRKAIGGVLLLA